VVVSCSLQRLFEMSSINLSWRGVHQEPEQGLGQYHPICQGLPVSTGRIREEILNPAHLADRIG